MKREDAMQDALSRGLTGSTDKAALATHPKGKGKGDNRGKGRSNSAPPGGASRNGPRAGAAPGKGKAENEAKKCASRSL